jgi:tetratricopeptide (TPR) repeat protein
VSLPLVLLLQVASAVAGSPTRSVALRAAAQASVRPRECAPVHGHSGAGVVSNVWDTARDPELGRYCDFLARGFAQLAFAPKAALESADAAEHCSPGRAAPAVLRGRALANLKAFDRAAVELEHARGIDSRSLEEPLTLRDWARALAHTGRAAEALAAYRSLGPRLSLLPSPEERARIFVEGAELALSLDGPAIDDALAFLGEARQLGVRELGFRIGSELALAMDRKGRQEEAAALAGELARDAHKGSAVRPGADDAAEAQAAWALVLERIDARQARAMWERYLASVGEASPWAAHARTHLERLRRGDAAR